MFDRIRSEVPRCCRGNRFGEFQSESRWEDVYGLNFEWRLARKFDAKQCAAIRLRHPTKLCDGADEEPAFLIENNISSLIVSVAGTVNIGGRFGRVAPVSDMT